VPDGWAASLTAMTAGGIAQRMQWLCPWPSGWQDTDPRMGVTGVPGCGECENLDRATIAKQQFFRKRHIGQS
jgi:hypothetical protein